MTVSKFDKTDLSFASFQVSGPAGSMAAGQTLARKLLAARPNLRGVLVLSEGLNVNGSELVRGFNSVLDPSIIVTGGLSGDGANFKRTWVSIGAKVSGNTIAAVGFYGDHIAIGHGSKGGWDKFGPERVVTRSEGNVLYELDGKPALQIYREYLGDKAKDLPSSGLLFPLSIRAHSKDTKHLVRTLLAVDHQANSLTFAGDIPKGSLAQLMKADFERLIDGASLASAMAQESLGKGGAESLVVAISCVGRRLVLGERAEEEIEAVHEGIANQPGAHLTGFYSYGELSPYASGHCDLHNQTMTLTVLSESENIVVRKSPARPSAPAEPLARTLASAPAPSVRTIVSAPPPPVPAPVSIRPKVPSPRTAGFSTATIAYSMDTKRWSSDLPAVDSARTLVLAFGAPEIASDPSSLIFLRTQYPKSILVGCSTAGEVFGNHVLDRSLSVSVTAFEHTDLELATTRVQSSTDSFSAAQNLARKLLGVRPGLRAVLVLSEGLGVNGSELVRGMNAVLPESVIVTGGLSGDGTAFKQTWVAVGSTLSANTIAAVGFYGDHLIVGHGSQGGWDKFGHERVVTRSEGNVLYELDGKPALELYKEYLGEKAADLPSSGLLFPLSLRAHVNDEKALVRTVLGVNHERNSMTFAGDIPEGYLARLMKADFERLVGGASLAAAFAGAAGAWEADAKALVVAVSCVGRRLVLGEQTEDELDAVLGAFPESKVKVSLTGFYSYGEISPYGKGRCDLHNQTMTLTVFSESAAPVVTQAAAATASQRPPDLGQELPTAVNSNHRKLAAQAAASMSPESARGPASSVSAGRLAKPATRITRELTQGSGATQATVDKRSINGVTIVTMRGRLSESFKGEDLGNSLSGDIVLDLADVERITSYGVREWLAMMARCEAHHPHLARCSSATVNQLSMIRKFAGGARLLSFFAPYLCGSCGGSFEALYDLVADKDAIAANAPVAAQCPRCDGAGRFDDDPSTFFSFAQGHIQQADVPWEIEEAHRAIVATVAATKRDAIDKVVEGNTTRLRVHARLGEDLRWPRILDGIEGKLVIDLGGVSQVEERGVALLLTSLTSMGAGGTGDITSVEIERCPERAADELQKQGLPKKTRVVSMMIDAFCTQCNASRPTLVAAQEHENTLVHGRPPEIRCRRCNGELRFERPERLGLMLAAKEPNSVATTMSSSLWPTPPPPSVLPIATSHAPVAAQLSSPPLPAPRAPWGLIAIAAGMVVSTGIFVFGRRPDPVSLQRPSASEQTERATPSVSAAPAPTAADTSSLSELPPAWVERGFSIDGNATRVVGHSAGAAAAEEAVRLARIDAINVLLRQVLKDIADPAVHDFLTQRLGTRSGQQEAVAERFQRDVGAFAGLERTNIYRRGNSADTYVQYTLSEGGYAKLITNYNESATFMGITVARVFPLLETIAHTDAPLVVVALPKASSELHGLRAGDYLLGVEGRRSTSPRGFTKDAADGWSKVQPKMHLSLDAESAGAARTIRLLKFGP